MGMQLKQQPLISSSEFLSNAKGQWALLYGLKLNFLNDLDVAHALWPFGDPDVHAVSASTFVTKRYNSSGRADTATFQGGPPNGWDTPFTNARSDHEGPALIPVLRLNGADEWITTPTNAFYTPDDAAGANGFAMGGWFSVDDVTGLDVFLSKIDGAAGAYSLNIKATDGVVRAQLFDESAVASAFRDTDSAVLTNQTWHQIIWAYAGTGGGTAANGITLYVDGAVAASTAINSGSYVGMEDQAENFAIGGKSSSAGFTGKIAGGPLGPWMALDEGMTAEQALYLYEMERRALGV